MSKGPDLPEVHYRPDEIAVFQYSAVIHNSHRIHYDLAYTRTHAGHDRLVVPGPLQGTYLEQLVSEVTHGRGMLRQFRYRNRAPGYIGDDFYAGGKLLPERSDENTEVYETWVRRGDGTITVTGEAHVELFRTTNNGS